MWYVDKNDVVRMIDWRYKMKKMIISFVLGCSVVAAGYKIVPSVVAWWNTPIPKYYTVHFDCPNCLNNNVGCDKPHGEPFTGRLKCPECGVSSIVVSKDNIEYRLAGYNTMVIQRTCLTVCEK